MERQEIVVFQKFDEGFAGVVEAQSAAAGPGHRGKLLRQDDMDVQMEDEFARGGVDLRQPFVRGFAAAFGLNVSGINMPPRRFAKEFLLGRLEPLESKERYIRLAHKRRFTPETHQFRPTPADDVANHRSIKSPGG